MRHSAILLATMLMICGCASNAANQVKGEFEPRRAIIQGPIPSNADLFELQNEIVFRDPSGKVWRAPKGTITDGASIPQQFLSLTGGQLSQAFREAAVVHDAYCGRGNENGGSYHKEKWQDVHRMFYDAMLACGTDRAKAKLMYAAVYAGGPRWPDPNVHAFIVVDPLEEDLAKNMRIPTTKVEQELRPYRARIEQGDPSLEEIERLMERARTNLIEAQPQSPGR